MNSPHYRAAALSIALSALMGGGASGASVPRDLVGKSAVITWTESRLDAFPSKGDQPFHADLIYVMSFYFSTQGRIFARWSWTAASPGKNWSTHTWETVGSDPNRSGAAPDAGSSTFQDLHFEGRTLIGLQKIGAIMFRRTEADFSDGASSCTAHITYARDVRVPKNEITYFRRWDGQLQRTIESHSSIPECSVKAGNVFE